MLNYVKAMFADDAGNPSSIRFVAVGVPVVVVVVWAWTCLTTGELVSFDWADVGAMTALSGAKAYQKGKEAPKEG